MKHKHKHAELIKAWADGAEIEYFSPATAQWLDVAPASPWSNNCEFRIKPEPKPDVCMSFSVVRVHNQTTQKQISCNPYQNSNLKLTFDGETGVLKSAEVLK